MSSRLKKVTDFLVESAIFPIRVSVGIVQAIKKNMPDKLELPIKVEIIDNDKKESEHKL